MLGRIFTVGGYTLLSRLTGFARDIMLAAILGAGPVADAFFVALRLPNHFRAIFAEGAFNAAFVPAYARIREQGGPDPAQLFADRVFTILFGCVGLLVLLALIFTPAVISLLAPGFSEDPGRFALAPATIGSAGTQIALFADTVIASFLAAGALSALYYADRLNQLPIGVVGIAVGTVLLPEMASRVAVGDEAGARRAQRRAIELTLLLSIPCLVAFLIIPDLIMRALFMRGKFTAADATAAWQTLVAYALGLLPFVLIRSVTATFLARGDTATPVKASLTAVAVNVAFKALFYSFTALAQVGLALATSIGAWLNLGLVIWFAARRGHLVLDPALRSAMLRLTAAAIALAAVLLLTRGPVAELFAGWTSWRDESTLAVLAMMGGVVYAAAIFALFGKEWLAALRARKHPLPMRPPLQPD